MDNTKSTKQGTKRTKENKTFDELSGRVIGCALEVHKALGPGLLESAYNQCLAQELKLAKIPTQSEVPVSVKYKGIDVRCGYRMDLLVDDRLIVELKSVDRLQAIHEAQILTYMRLAGVSTGLLINFNSPRLKEGIKRYVF